MARPVVLVIDIGSSSVRASFFDAAAQCIPGAVVQIPVSFSTSVDGGSWIDAGGLFTKIIDAVDQLLVKHRDVARRVVAVASDSFAGNLLGVDSEYQPLTPVYTYADTRNAAEVTRLRAELGTNGARAAHQRTATVLHTSYAPARLRWIQRSEPELYQRVAHWITFGEYLMWRLFAVRGTSLSVASWNGLLNYSTLTWDPEWLRILDLTEEQLSPLTDLDAPVTGLRSPWAERWESLAQVPWFPTIGDGAAANIGSGCTTPDRLALTLGTTGAMRVVVNPTDVKEVPAGLWCYRVERTRALLGGATTEGGNLFAWMKSSLQLPNPSEIENALATRMPAAHGLTVLPFIAGERAPGWNENARASIHGLSLSSSPLDIVQASLEAIAYRFAAIYAKITEQIPATSQRQIVVGGGALLASPAWIQIFADVLGEPLVTLLEKENTSRGIALLALERLGIIPSASHLRPEMGTVYQPRSEYHDVHQRAIERQQEIYGRLLERGLSGPLR